MLGDKKKEIYDVVIIGGGPAGLTAGIYSARAALRVLLLAGDTPGGQLMRTALVENYPGFEDGVMGPDLMIAMRRQAEKLGVAIRDAKATEVDFSDKIKRVAAGEVEYFGRAVIAATGAKARMLGVGEEKLLGRGVAVCAVCDAPFYKGKRAAVVGGGDAAMEDALALAKYAKKVYVIHRRDKLRASQVMAKRVTEHEKIEVLWRRTVSGVVGEAKLEEVELTDVQTGQKTRLKLDGLFMAVGHLPATELFAGKLELDKAGYIVLKPTGAGEKERGFSSATSVAGVFAAGDNHDFTYRQAVTAAGYGCQAALDAERWLASQKK